MVKKDRLLEHEVEINILKGDVIRLDKDDNGVIWAMLVSWIVIAIIVGLTFFPVNSRLDNIEAELETDNNQMTASPSMVFVYGGQFEFCQNICYTFENTAEDVFGDENRDYRACMDGCKDTLYVREVKVIEN